MSAMLPSAPWEIREEVELYARESGRTGSIAFVPVLNAWEVRLSLRCNDPEMRAYQEGRRPEPPVESVLLVEPNPLAGTPDGKGGRHGPYISLDIQQLGASGVRRFLEKGNTWSGRGQFRSVEDAVKQARDGDERAKQRFRERMKEENRYERREQRRQYLGIPLLPVGIDLKTNNGE